VPVIIIIIILLVVFCQKVYANWCLDALEWLLYKIF